MNFGRQATGVEAWRRLNRLTNTGIWKASCINPSMSMTSGANGYRQTKFSRRCLKNKSKKTHKIFESVGCFWCLFRIMGLMRKRRVIISIASAILLMIATVGCCHMGGRVAVKAQPPYLLRSQDPSLIEQSVHTSRWSVTQEMRRQHQFKMLFSGCIPDLVFGHVCEIGSWHDAVIDGLSATHFSSRSYAVSRNCFEKRGVRYDLQLTNNNWKVIMVSRE